MQPDNDLDVQDLADMFPLLAICSLVFMRIWQLCGHSVQFQKRIHLLPQPLPILLQPYSVFFMLTFGLLMYEMSHIIATYLSTKFLDPTQVEHLCEVEPWWYNATKQESFSISSFTWLRWLSVGAPIVGTLAFIIVFVHAVTLLKKFYQMHLPSRSLSATRFETKKKEDLVYAVITMPIMFIIMAIRCPSRIWDIISCQSDLKYEHAMTLYGEDLEIANLCQFYVVWMFTMLCLDFLHDMSGQCQGQLQANLWMMTKMAAFQGAWSWIVVGGIQSLLMFMALDTAYCTSLDVLSCEAIETLHNAVMKVLPHLSDVSSFTSILATINMVVICRLPFLHDHIKSANMKFLGLKGMLLIAPNQLKILLQLSSTTQGSGIKASIADMLGLSAQRAYLLHSSLLCYECFFAVVLNVIFWRPSEMESFKASDLSEPLKVSCDVYYDAHEAV